MKAALTSGSGEDRPLDGARRPMSGHHHIEVLARGDVRSLARVVDVLALLELTPQALHSLRAKDGVRIRFSFTAETRKADLCRARLRQLVVVEAIIDRDASPSDDVVTS